MRCQTKTGSAFWADSEGEFFDREIHAWSAKDNRPSVKSDGTFRARRGAGVQLENQAEEAQT